MLTKCPFYKWPINGNRWQGESFAVLGLKFVLYLLEVYTQPFADPHFLDFCDTLLHMGINSKFNFRLTFMYFR